VPPPEVAPPPIGDVVVRFSIHNARLEEGQTMLVTGSVPALGNWVKDQAIPLQEVTTGLFEANLYLPLTSFPFQFKFGIRTGPHSAPLHLERGASRVLSLGSEESQTEVPQLVIAHCGYFKYTQPWQVRELHCYPDSPVP
jgi:hypothetical protein